jgi:hypothetical protein
MKKYLIIIFNILSIFVFIIYKINIFLSLIFLIVGNIIIILLNKLYCKYIIDLERKKIEYALLDEILVLSSQPRINDLNQLLTKLSHSNNKLISKEFRIILHKIEEGHSVKDVLFVFSKKYNSEILDRFLDLLYGSITTGTTSVIDYRSFANNFLKSKQLIDERNSVLLIQKYTIIFAGCFIVPGILGIVISLVNKLIGNLDFSLIDASTKLASNTMLFSTCYYCSIIYIIEYVFISSIYLSMLESDIKKTIIYIIFLMPISIIIFFLSSILI